MLLFGYHPFDSTLRIHSTESIQMSIFGKTAQEDLKDVEGDLKDTKTCWNILNSALSIPPERIGTGDLEGEFIDCFPSKSLLIFSTFVFLAREILVHLLDSNPDVSFSFIIV